MKYIWVFLVCFYIRYKFAVLMLVAPPVQVRSHSSHLVIPYTFIIHRYREHSPRAQRYGRSLRMHNTSAQLQRSVTTRSRVLLKSRKQTATHTNPDCFLCPSRPVTRFHKIHGSCGNACLVIRTDLSVCIAPYTRSLLDLPPPTPTIAASQMAIRRPHAAVAKCGRHRRTR